MLKTSFTPIYTQILQNTDQQELFVQCPPTISVEYCPRCSLRVGARDFVIRILLIRVFRF